jgi:hypothetical protein
MNNMTSTSITISKTTLSILKNFASMNSNILVKPGNVIKTITPSKSGMAEAVIDETFDVEFGIWDLNKFLGVVSLFSSPHFEFGEKSVKIIGSNGSVVNYFYSEPRLLTYPSKSVNMPPTTVKTRISEGMFNELYRISSVLQLPDISFRSDGSAIYAVVLDLKDPTSNSYRVDLEGNADGAQFELNFKMENIRLLAGDYEVSFAKNIAGQFENENHSLTYWFAMEPNSRYTE